MPVTEAERLQSLHAWLLCSGDSEEQIAVSFDDTLAVLCASRFDPSRADGAGDPPGGPPWLGELLERARWRELVYTLHARHPSSALLNTAVQRLLASPAHAAEAAERTSESRDAAALAGGSSVAHLLDCLADRLAARLSGGPGASKALVALCAGDEASAACSALLLGGLCAAAEEAAAGRGGEVKGEVVPPGVVALLQHATAEVAAAAAERSLGAPPPPPSLLLPAPPCSSAPPPCSSLPLLPSVSGH